jgi:antitoxin component YwqK of YwqJK toxin-antitoxin module
MNTKASSNVTTAPKSSSSFRVILWICLAVTVFITIESHRFVPDQRTAAQLVEASRRDLVLKDGRLYLPNSTAPFSGVMLDRLPNGILLSRSMVLEGKLHGLSEGYYTNGQIQVRELFLAGTSHGLRTKWHPNGLKLSQGRIIRGNFEGTFRRWHSNGNLAEQYQMVNGQPEGLAESWYPTGAPQSRAIVRNGKPTELQRWPDQSATTPQLARVE